MPGFVRAAHTPYVLHIPPMYREMAVECGFVVHTPSDSGHFGLLRRGMYTNSALQGRKHVHTAYVPHMSGMYRTVAYVPHMPRMYRTNRVCTVHTAYVYPKRIMGEEDAALHRDRRPPTGVAEIFEKIRIFV